jgi:hypothetical protein
MELRRHLLVGRSRSFGGGRRDFVAPMADGLEQVGAAWRRREGADSVRGRERKRPQRPSRGSLLYPQEKGEEGLPSSLAHHNISLLLSHYLILYSFV